MPKFFRLQAFRTQLPVDVDSCCRTQDFGGEVGGGSALRAGKVRRGYETDVASNVDAAALGVIARIAEKLACVVVGVSVWWMGGCKNGGWAEFPWRTTPGQRR